MKDKWWDFLFEKVMPILACIALIDAILLITGLLIKKLF